MREEPSLNPFSLTCDAVSEKGDESFNSANSFENMVENIVQRNLNQPPSLNSFLNSPEELESMVQKIMRRYLTKIQNQCFFCKAKGHFKRDCNAYKQFLKRKESENQNAEAENTTPVHLNSQGPRG